MLHHKKSTLNIRLPTVIQVKSQMTSLTMNVHPSNQRKTLVLLATKWIGSKFLACRQNVI